MMKEKFEKVKELVVKKSEKDNKKTIESVVFFVIILIVTIIAINTIWNNDKEENVQNKTTDNKKLAQTSYNQKNDSTEDNDNIEEKLENILMQMEGVGKVKVLITYSRTSQVVPLYNEDLQESITEETDKEGGTRTINENSSKKDVVYQETNGTKTPITQSTISPKIEGAVITAEGAQNAQIKANIIQAIEAVTGLATHKIQVFEMKK